MIHATDFDDLVYTCTQLLQDEHADIVGKVAETIHTDSSYAAITVMAFYKAAHDLSIDVATIDDIMALADKNCSNIMVEDYRRILTRLKKFDDAEQRIHLSPDKFFVPPSRRLH